MVQLLYDNIVYSLQKYGGISTYWSELSSRALQDAAVDITFFEGAHDQQNVLRSALAIPANNIVYNKVFPPAIDRFMRVAVPVAYTAQSIFHSSYFRLPKKSVKLKKVCTVHDFIHDKYFRGPRAVLHNYPKRKCIRESDLIITVSENTKKDLLAYYPDVDPQMVITVYNGVSHLFEPVAKDSVTGKPYLLYIGARNGYKNFTYSITLMSVLKDYDLYIVGSPLAADEEKALNEKLGNRYKTFSGISTEALNLLYNNAFCLLYPSSYEGFGIPLLEAMAVGCPFIAFNGSSIPEVAGTAGYLLQVLSIENGLAAVEAIAGNYKDFQKRGFERVKEFSWDKCYLNTMQVYKKLL